MRNFNYFTNIVANLFYKIDGLRISFFIHFRVSGHQPNIISFISRDNGVGIVIGNVYNSKISLYWPIKADFRVVYVANDYSYTIIARNKRDYVWLMSRNPEMDEETYSQAINFIEEIGYDIGKIVKVPHQWQK